MKKSAYLLLVLALSQAASAQKAATDTSWKKEYRETPARINDLVHTKMAARFDYPRSYMYGQVWITLQPHFYPTDSLTLDAKGMDVHRVALVKGNQLRDLKYDYDGWQLRIRLDRTYRGGEKYTVFVDYTAKPNEVKVKGSAAISDAKGLYFINPLGTEKDKPTQIWTQGETEATSVYCPTIDRPNQKTTQEFILTVPGKYVSLSNGKLISQKKNTDGTRTDHWKMDQPHAPYLFFIGVGDYAVVRDSWKGKEVSYYVEKEYAPVARRIFGMTPEMMSFFSRITGIEYPWVKYSQMTARDYVSGAMENTTATLHSAVAQQDARELTDGNQWEPVIAHELFHQWFGDYVTTESWSNITLNESFANYSEMLWAEYKYGKDAGDEQHYNDMQGYLHSNSEKKDLVRFHYRDKEDVFDAVSYNKGGRILHMLRNFVGDSAFFRSLNLFLTTNKFKAAEAHQLRLAFEEVTGRDLNWFWNQWYFGAGHPDLDIKYSYDASAKRVRVIVSQKQSDKLFHLPVAIDIYRGGNKDRQKVWVKNKVDTFYFHSAAKPDLVNFDGDKMLLATKTENKTVEEYMHQYTHAGTYLDRREALQFAAANQDKPAAIELLRLGLRDRFEGLRGLAISLLDLEKENVRKAVETQLVSIAKNDPKRLVKAAAIEKLGSFGNPEYADIFISAVRDSSYTVAGNALEALYGVDSARAVQEAIMFSDYRLKGNLLAATTNVLIEAGNESFTDMILTNFENMPTSQAKFSMLQSVGKLLERVTNSSSFRRGVDAILAFRDAIPQSFRTQTDPFINDMLLAGVEKRKRAAGQTELADYVKSKLSEKKGF